MSGVNEYFNKFKSDNYLNTPNSYESVQRKPSTLPPVDDIIAESLKVKLNLDELNSIGEAYKQKRKQLKNKNKKKIVKLSKVKKQVLKEMHQEQELRIEKQRLIKTEVDRKEETKGNIKQEQSVQEEQEETQVVMLK